MKRARRHASSGPGIRTGALLAVVAALVGTVSWAFLARPKESGTRGPVVEAAQPEAANPTDATGPRPLLPSASEPTFAPPAPPIPTGVRPRSPLERSPGYYPPADPESMSVITGRRNAPAVDLELTGGASSMRDLARLLLDDVEARDEKAMHALRLTKREFEVICWPEFPESRPITHITVDDAWEFQVPTSLAGAGRAIGAYGGHDLTLVSVQASRVDEFRNFKLHRDVVLVVHDNSTGENVGLHFVPSVVERHGRFKALLFKDR